jgi:hypothetical protein
MRNIFIYVLILIVTVFIFFSLINAIKLYKDIGAEMRPLTICFIILFWMWIVFKLSKKLKPNSNQEAIYLKNNENKSLSSRENIKIKNENMGNNQNRLIKNAERNYLKAFMNLVNFKLRFNQEFINEGTRRLLVLLSYCTPIFLIIKYLLSGYGGREEYYITGIVGSYIIFHVMVHIIKWILAGYKIKNHKNKL